jgi:hypothetical protein
VAKKVDKVEIVFTGKDTTKKATQSANNNIKSVEESSLAMNAALAAAAVATIATITKAVNAYARQEQAILQLEQRIKSTGGAAGLTGDQLTSMAAGLQKVTTFGDEAIIEMQSLLLTFKEIQGPQFERSTEAILNVAQAMGTDLKSAALQVGKALNDPVGQMSALSRSGIQFSKEQKELIKTLVETNKTAEAQNIILEELDSQFGGAARAAREGTGAITAASNAVGDLWEAIGKRLSPTVVQLAKDVEQLAIRFTDFISPTEQSKIRDEIDLTTDKLNELRGELQRAEAAQKGGAIARFFFGDAEDSTRIKAEIAELEQSLASLQGKAQEAAPAAITAATGTRVDSGQAAGLSAKQQKGLEEFKQEQSDRLFTLEAERLEREEQLRIEEEANARQFIIEADNWRITQREMMIASSLEAAQREAQQRIEIDAAMRNELGKGLQNLGSLMNSESRKAFEVGKAASIAQATLNTYESATASFTSLAKIPIVGPALGAAAAAAAIAAGLANVQKIQSTTFGGGGGGGGSSYSAVASAQTDAVGPTPVTQPQPDIQTSQGGPGVEVATGGFLGDWLENQFAPAWEEARSRGVGLRIT